MGVEFLTLVHRFYIRFNAFGEAKGENDRDRSTAYHLRFAIFVLLHAHNFNHFLYLVEFFENALLGIFYSFNSQILQTERWLKFACYRHDECLKDYSITEIGYLT